MRGQNGVTIIALTVTIIVILILAGVTIANVTGDDGTINNALDASLDAQKRALIDEVQIDIIGEEQLMAAPLSEEQLINVLKRYFDVPEGMDLSDKTQQLTSKEEYGNVQITLAEILVEE